jgi:putative alpha-1,2-mannosidase
MDESYSPVDGIYVIGSPLFEEVTLQLDSRYYKGGEFTVRARNNSAKNMYIQSAALNGKPLDRAWLRHSEIVAGGILEVLMGSSPNEAWGAAPDQLPPSHFPAAH